MELHNDVKIPISGIGTSHIGGFSSQAIQTALDIGINLIDTASRYGNQNELKKILARVDRDKVFITSKLWPGDASNVDKQYDIICSNLGVDYLDLFLIHWPGKIGSNDYAANKKYRIDTWKQLEKLYIGKKVRSIGVSNFIEKHLNDILNECEIIPHVNQIEFNPYQNPSQLITFCRSKNIQIQGFCPLAKGKVLNDPRLVIISRKYNKTPAQILIRWSIQHNVSTIPKSTKIKNIKENNAIFDFTLSKEDFDYMNTWHLNLRSTWDSSSIQ